MIFSVKDEEPHYSSPLNKSNKGQKQRWNPTKTKPEVFAEVKHKMCQARASIVGVV